MLTPDQVAAQLKAPVTTVYDWIDKGRFPGAVIEQRGKKKMRSVPASDLIGFVRPKRGGKRKKREKEGK